MAAELFDFQGKVVLVTGGSRGLGRQMAVAFARSGADVAVTSRKIEACEEVAAEIEALGRQALAVASHVGHWDELDGLVDAVYDRFGRLDVLVNNAGMSPLYPSLEEVSEDLFDKVIAVNLKGPFRLSALVGSRMAAGDGGCILNISSNAAVHPSPAAEPYGSAKAGLNALTRSLAFAYGPKVRVNCIQAGPFFTDVSRHWEAWRRSKAAPRKVSRCSEAGTPPRSWAPPCICAVPPGALPPVRFCRWMAEVAKGVEK